VFDERSKNPQGAAKLYGKFPRESAQKRALAQPAGEETITAAQFLITHLGDCAKPKADLD